MLEGTVNERNETRRSDISVDHEAGTNPAIASCFLLRKLVTVS